MQALYRRFYYWAESLVLRHPTAQLGLVAGAILLLTLGGGLAVYLSGDIPDLPASLWWAFLRLTDPGYLGEDRGAWECLISTLLTLAGYVVFLGALVAIMTNALARALGLLASGQSPILERGHLLVLGADQRLPALIEELVHSYRRLVSREQKPAVVILTENFEPVQLRELRLKLEPEVREACRLIWRRGELQEPVSWERVNAAEAYSIILLSHHHLHPALSDVSVTRTLLSLTDRLGKEATPHVIADLHDPGNKGLVEAVGWPGRVEAVVASEIVGRLLLQTVRNPGLSRVYRHLLTDTFGEALVVRPIREQRGQSVRELLQRVGSGEGLPVGVVRRLEGEPLLRLEEPLGEGSLLYLLPSQNRGKWRKPRPLRQGASRKETIRLLVLGWNSRLLGLLEELDNTRNLHWEVVVAAPEFSKQLQRWSDSEEGPSLELRRVEADHRHKILALEPESFDSVLLMADINAEEPGVADAQTVIWSHWISQHLELNPAPTQLIAELQEEDNEALLHDRVDDVFPTHEVISHLLAQVALYPDLSFVFEELFTAGGSDIRLVEPERGDQYANFARELLEIDLILLGVWGGKGIDLVPSGDTAVTPEDWLLVLG